MMGGQSSKRRSSESPPPQPLQSQASSQYLADLTSYEDACEVDPELRSFDNNLHERTTHVINSLASGVELRSLSFETLKEVTNCLLDINQEVVKVILECKQDVWNNQELFALVEDYFGNSAKTLEFCNALDKCLRRARNARSIIMVAVKQFEEELELQDGVVEKTYVKTLEQLQKFKAAGDPFDEEFFTLFQSVYKQQVTMLQKLQVRKGKLDKKLKSMKSWRKVSNVLFVATFVSVLIFSVVAAAIAAPPVVAALAGALAAPVGSVGKWCNSLWNSYLKALKGQRELMSSMQIGTFIAIQDLDHIRVLVNKLEVLIGSLLQNADFVLREEDAVKLVIDEMKKSLEAFMEIIEDLGQHGDKCSRDVTHARTVILQRIIKYPDQ